MLQAREFFKAVERENEVRTEYSQGSDIFHSLEDLKLGSKGNLEELNPGRRVQLTLGEPGLSRFSYKAVLLDAQKDSGPFTYHCGVFLVPKVVFSWCIYNLCTTRGLFSFWVEVKQLLCRVGVGSLLISVSPGLETSHSPAARRLINHVLFVY